MCVYVCVYTYTYICIMKYYSDIKRMNFCHLQQCGWMQSILNETSQTEKDKCYLLSLTCENLKLK